MNSQCLRFSFILLLMVNGLYSAFSQVPESLYEVDKHALSAPKFLHNDLADLAAYLAAPTQSDLEKVRAFYTWIVHNIRYDREAQKKDVFAYNYRPGEVLKKEKAVCTGFSHLMKEMCSLYDIPAEVISGYTKEGSNLNSSLSTPDHAWNAIKINEGWYLFDVTWAAGHKDSKRKRNVEDPYFKADPAIFIQDHLPALPMWQLLDCPITVDDFKASKFDLDNTIKPCYNYNDSIAAYISMDRPEQRLFEGKITYYYHPSDKNKSMYGHALLDYAAFLSDSTETLLSLNDLSQVKAIQNQIIRVCREAYQLTEFHTWQREMYARTLINYTVAGYNETVGSGNVPESQYREWLDLLDEARDLLRNTEETFFVRAAREQCEEIYLVIQNHIAR